MVLLRNLFISAFVGAALYAQQSKQCWIYRDDIGAWWGIKGYEEQVSEVGTHHGRLYWPQYSFMGNHDSGAVRRGFQVFTRNCSNCHSILGKKYDILLDKVYGQAELSAWVAENFTIHPAHQHFKQYYYQEWDDRDRYIHDHMYTTYYSQDQAKNANGGVWPTDFTKIRMRPGAINYIYNIMTGYHFKPPFGIDVPKGKYFNPYFDHMIIGMPRQLHDGMLDYEDGTPASTPQMASDVTTFINYIQRRTGYKRSDRKIMQYMVVTAVILSIPFKYLKTNAYYRNLYSYRTEVYAVRDKLGYKHWKSGFNPVKATQIRGNMWI